MFVRNFEKMTIKLMYNAPFPGKVYRSGENFFNAENIRAK